MVHFLVQQIGKKVIEGRPIFRYEGVLFCIVTGINLDALARNLEDDQIVLAVQCANCILITSRLPYKHIPTLLSFFRGEEEARFLPQPTQPELIELRAWQSRYNARILRNLTVAVSFGERRPMLFSNQAVTVGDMHGILKGDRYWNGAIVRAIRALPANLNLRLLQETLQKMRDNEQEFITKDGREMLCALAAAGFGVFSTEEVLGVVRQILARHDRRNVPNSQPSRQKYC